MGWKDSLVPGAIVCCRFPDEERPGEPSSKIRPVIITRIRLGDQFLTPLAEVMFGTSVRSHTRDPNIQINRADELNQAGLRQPTKFLLKKRAIIPVTEQFFVRNRNGDVAIGTFPHRALKKAKSYFAYETEKQRARALRFGRKTMQSTWTPSSVQTKELTHA